MSEGKGEDKMTQISLTPYEYEVITVANRSGHRMMRLRDAIPLRNRILMRDFILGVEKFKAKMRGDETSTQQPKLERQNAVIVNGKQKTTPRREETGVLWREASTNLQRQNGVVFDYNQETGVLQRQNGVVDDTRSDAPPATHTPLEILALVCESARRM